MEGSKDDWLFDSLYRYERLHMFELPHSTRCLEWADRDGTSLYVGGFSDKHTNEIEMLELPEALQPQGQENVCAHTDFKITCGGLTKPPIMAIKCISDMNVVATAGTETCVSIWMKDPENTDLLTLHTSLQLRNVPSDVASSRPVLLDHTPDTPSWLLGAKAVGSATVWDLNSNLPISLPIHAQGTGSPPSADDSSLHGLKFVGPQLCVVCSGEAIGTLALWDLRSPTIAAHTQVSCLTPHRDTQGTSRFALSVDKATERVAVLSIQGEVSVFESRQLGAALCSCTLDQGQKQRFSGGGRFSGLRTTAAANLCIEFSCDGTKVAVSGLTNGVNIYDTSNWSPSTQEVSPLFTHTGHEAECPGAVVLTHTWHPVFADTVLSADSEGNLHAWQWKSQLDK